jgi:putative YphP/YqiW family bacilliredoxin
MYPEEIVAPCRKELTDAGVEEFKSADDVDAAMKDHSGTMLIVVNSVCGCAAGSARPGVRMALEHPKVPDRVATVFAGVDADATARARSYIAGYQPSSPSVALFKDGHVVYMMERHMIEGREPAEIAQVLKAAFDAHCR